MICVVTTVCILLGIFTVILHGFNSCIILALSSQITHPLLLQDILLQDIVWSKPFSKLRNTSDDGNRKLTMEFADSSKQVGVEYSKSLVLLLLLLV